MIKNDTYREKEGNYIKTFFAFFGGASSYVKQVDIKSYESQFVLGLLSIITPLIYIIILYFTKKDPEVSHINNLFLIQGQSFRLVLILYYIFLIFLNGFCLSFINNRRISGNEKMAFKEKLVYQFRFCLSLVNPVFLYGLLPHRFMEEGQIALLIFLGVLDFLPFIIKRFRRPMPYDYVIEIENKKQTRTYQEKLNKYKDELEQAKAGKLVEDASNKKTIEKSKVNKKSKIYLTKIIIKSIRSLEHIVIVLSQNDDHKSMITSIIGDNSLGKSTILKAISLGLTDESGSIALMKADKGKFIKYGSKKGTIELYLKEFETHKKCKIITEISVDRVTREEIIRKEIEDDHSIYNDLFVCAYGSQRSVSSDQSITEYNTFEAVKSLFNKSTKLLNPELVLLRENEETRLIIFKTLKEIIKTDSDSPEIAMNKKGVTINGFDIYSSSDGFVSTMNWVLDLYGRAISFGLLEDNNSVSGIVIIDELEMHLHPKWQRLIINKLKNKFPLVQFILTTHTPLIVSGTADYEDSLILGLEDNDGQAVIRRISNERIENKSVSDIMMENFEVFSLKSPKAFSKSLCYDELMSLENRTKKEDQELLNLRESLYTDYDKIINKENDFIENLKKYKDD